MSNDTIILSWSQPDERSENREDSCWYTYASGHDCVVLVTKGDRTLSVCADGEMRFEAYKRNADEEFIHEGTIRYSDQLEEFGVREDSDLWGLPDASNIMPDMTGPNRFGYYYVGVNNSWFDLYSEEGEHLDCVRDTLSDAIETATEIINDDTDELWGRE